MDDDIDLQTSQSLIPQPTTHCGILTVIVPTLQVWNPEMFTFLYTIVID